MVFLREIFVIEYNKPLKRATLKSAPLDMVQNLKKSTSSHLHIALCLLENFLNFVEEILYFFSFQVTGLLNETIGSYTCTRGCDAPIEYDSVFTNDWDNTTGSDIGTVVK